MKFFPRQPDPEEAGQYEEKIGAVARETIMAVS